MAIKIKEQMEKKLICKNCGHELWYANIHKNRDPATNECLHYDKDSGCCGCTGE